MGLKEHIDFLSSLTVDELSESECLKQLLLSLQKFTIDSETKEDGKALFKIIFPKFFEASKYSSISNENINAKIYKTLANFISEIPSELTEFLFEDTGENKYIKPLILISMQQVISKEYIECHAKHILDLIIDCLDRQSDEYKHSIIRLGGTVKLSAIDVGLIEKFDHLLFELCNIATRATVMQSELQKTFVMLQNSCNEILRDDTPIFDSYFHEIEDEGDVDKMERIILVIPFMNSTKICSILNSVSDLIKNSCMEVTDFRPNIHSINTPYLSTSAKSGITDFINGASETGLCIAAQLMILDLDVSRNDFLENLQMMFDEDAINPLNYARTMYFLLNEFEGDEFIQRKKPKIYNNLLKCINYDDVYTRIAGTSALCYLNLSYKQKIAILPLMLSVGVESIQELSSLCNFIMECLGDAETYVDRDFFKMIMDQMGILMGAARFEMMKFKTGNILDFVTLAIQTMERLSNLPPIKDGPICNMIRSMLQDEDEELNNIAIETIPKLMNIFDSKVLIEFIDISCSLAMKTQSQKTFCLACELLQMVVYGVFQVPDIKWTNLYYGWHIQAQEEEDEEEEEEEEWPLLAIDESEVEEVTGLITNFINGIVTNEKSFDGTVFYEVQECAESFGSVLSDLIFWGQPFEENAMEFLRHINPQHSQRMMQMFAMAASTRLLEPDRYYKFFNGAMELLRDVSNSFPECVDPYIELAFQASRSVDFKVEADDDIKELHDMAFRSFSESPTGTKRMAEAVICLSAADSVIGSVEEIKSSLKGIAADLMKSNDQVQQEIDVEYIRNSISKLGITY